MNLCKKARDRLGMSQTEFSKFIQVHPMTISRWERGIVPITGTSEILLFILSEVDMAVIEQLRKESCSNS